MMLTAKRTRMLTSAIGALGLLAVGSAALAADYHAVLNGNKEFGGDLDGWARVKLKVDPAADRLCADLETRAVGQITGVYVYRGKPGDKSEPVIKLDTPNGWKDNDSDDCDKIGDALSEEIQSNPSNFYISVRTAEHPDGALAGSVMPGEFKG